MKALNHTIRQQKEKILKGNPTIELMGSCRIDNGIGLLSEESKKRAIHQFEQTRPGLNISFFIPSSGSGSRMFGSAYEFLNKDKPSERSIEFVEHLINSIETFAFYNKLSQELKDDLKAGTVEIEPFLKHLLLPNGFNFGNRPKGLIPFHRYGKFVINPFQEHILQGAEVGGEKSHFHFTINERFQEDIQHSIKILREITGIDFYFDFSIQSESSNAIAFDEDGAPVYDQDGNLISRPAGHGALIENLNQIDSDLIFIRNIDNVQHQEHATNSAETRKMLGGVLLDFQSRVFNILHTIDAHSDYLEAIRSLNIDFDLKLREEDLKNPELLHEYLNRPIRICGMVKNEGQPGGGPFWVADKAGRPSRQIVEKSQISGKNEQLNMLIKSTHFNPVEIICAPKNYRGEKFDLEGFRDQEQYFIVKKDHKGTPVQFIEQPGLWNGGMYHWNTLFFEIGSECFSPVKTVLDLLKPLHRRKK